MAEERKTAPVQGYEAGIPWSLHLEAYDAYRKRYGPQKALIEGGCRGGFGTSELDEFIPGWRDRVSEITQLRQRVAEVEDELVSTRDDRETYAIENDELRAKLALAEQLLREVSDKYDDDGLPGELVLCIDAFIESGQEKGHTPP